MARNLKDIVDEIHEQLDGNPDLKTERTGIVRRFNRKLQDFCEQDWYFLYSPARPLLAYATVEGSSSETVAITTNTFQVTFTGITPLSTWDGHVFVGPDGSAYPIVKVSGSSIWLETRYAGATVTASSDWSVTFETYQLPLDARSLLWIIDRDVQQQKFLYVSPSMEARYNLRPAIVGTSRVVVDEVQVIDRAPPAMTAAVSVGGSLTANTDYEYGLTFLYGGRESPMSPILLAETTTANKTVTLTLPDTRDGSGSNTTGLWKRVYRRNATLRGRWLKLSDNIAEATTSQVDDGTISVSTLTPNEYIPQEPLRQVIRLWPTPSQDATLEIRYIRRVRDLYADEDVAPIPDAAVSHIVYAALADICEQHGAAGAATRWAARAQERLRHLESIELGRRQTVLQRESSSSFGDNAYPPATPYWGPHTGLS